MMAPQSWTKRALPSISKTVPVTDILAGLDGTVARNARELVARW